MIDYMYCYRNYRPDVDWNTCGQAAIASITDYYGRNPYNLRRTQYIGTPYGGRWYWNDGEAIDSIYTGGFGPNVIFGLGTTGEQIRNALRAYGLNASVAYSGFGFWGWENHWRQLQNYLTWNRPVPVIVDTGRLGGPAWGAHWAIAYKRANGRVYLGNMGGWNSAPTDREFLSAWECAFLPFTFNHCGVYC